MNDQLNKMRAMIASAKHKGTEVNNARKKIKTLKTTLENLRVERAMHVRESGSLAPHLHCPHLPHTHTPSQGIMDGDKGGAASADPQEQKVLGEIESWKNAYRSSFSELHKLKVHWLCVAHPPPNPSCTHTPTPTPPPTTMEQKDIEHIDKVVCKLRKKRAEDFESWYENSLKKVGLTHTAVAAISSTADTAQSRPTPPGKPATPQRGPARSPLPGHTSAASTIEAARNGSASSDSKEGGRYSHSAGGASGGAPHYPHQHPHMQAHMQAPHPGYNQTAPVAPSNGAGVVQAWRGPSADGHRERYGGGGGHQVLPPAGGATPAPVGYTPGYGMPVASGMLPPGAPGAGGGGGGYAGHAPPQYYQQQPPQQQYYQQQQYAHTMPAATGTGTSTAASYPQARGSVQVRSSGASTATAAPLPTTGIRYTFAACASPVMLFVPNTVPPPSTCSSAVEDDVAAFQNAMAQLHALQASGHIRRPAP